MDLKKEIESILEKELEILAFEQKRLNQYKNSDNYNAKAGNLQQKLINKRLEYFNNLRQLIDLTDRYFKDTIHKIMDGAKKGYYIPEQWQSYLHQSIKAGIETDLAAANSDYQKAYSGSLAEKLAIARITINESLLRTLPFQFK